MNSRHSLPVAPNLLEQDFTAMAPNEKWIGDITYLATGEGWLYLAVLIDLFSRKVIGWAMSERMTADLAGNALQMRCGAVRCPRRSSSIRIAAASTVRPYTSRC